MTINALGYAGDGLASLSDEFIATTLVGSRAGNISTAEDITIPLDVAFVEMLIGSNTHLGLRLESATTGPFVNTAATESLSGFGPTLTLTFALLQPGDFDGDLDVDGDDFLKWQRGESPNPYSMSDLTNWEENYGVAPHLSSTAASVPEPSTSVTTILGIMIVTRRRRHSLVV